MSFKITLLLMKLISVVKFINADLEGKIVGGEFSSIKKFPHSVFVVIKRADKSSACGASILNQAILLTAAHCLYSCEKNSCKIEAYTGSETKRQGFLSNVSRYKIHEEYNPVSKAKDIALMRLGKDLKLGNKVKRVAIMRNPPMHKRAEIAGWGWVDSMGKPTNLLKHAKQQVFSRKTCFGKLYVIPLGTICGRDFKGASYPEKGDSGSALVVLGSIQIGIVSFKKRKLANDTIVYTDVSYYYDWIVKNAKDLYCNYCKDCKTLKWAENPERKNKLINRNVKERMGEKDLNFGCRSI